MVRCFAFILLFRSVQCTDRLQSCLHPFRKGTRCDGAWFPLEAFESDKADFAAKSCDVGLMSEKFTSYKLFKSTMWVVHKFHQLV